MGPRHQHRGRGTPELRAGRVGWNAQLPNLVDRYHLGGANLRTGGNYPRLALHQDRATLHSSLERSQAT